MALILAIEPDRNQANQLTAMARGRLHADLVIEATAERAFAELGDRVPDLILTAALLSPRDEAALGERLRALESAAAHVHTLTIPVLAAPRSRPRVGGMLSALRRDRASSELDGCDPAVSGDNEISAGERWLLTRAALYPSDSPGIAQFLGLANWLISRVCVSSPDRARDAIARVDEQRALRDQHQREERDETDRDAPVEAPVPDGLRHQLLCSPLPTR